MGKLSTDRMYSGFTVNKQVFIKELDADMYTLEHKQTGAQVVYIDSDDDNKVFSVTFRTPPSDSTGVFHILEHSLLCGSEKFDVKEPFVELLKGSMNTFLNALTYADKTMYPVASRNEKDFLNLMDVYLDSVFNPNIAREEEIFKQEGWHCEPTGDSDRLAYKGVVYNEMKGVFSSPDSILFNSINESLFPDTAYRHVYGGDPEKITDLSYEKFMETYRRYYHPSNSYIYLYGDMDVEEKLALIDRDYLSKYERKQIDSAVAMQEPIKDMLLVKEYEILESDTEENKVHMSLNFVIGDHSNRERVLAFEMLEKILLSSDAAPLKKALIDKGIGQNVVGFFNSGIRQPVLSVMVKNASSGQEEALKQTVVEELEKLVREGIDKKLIEGVISKSEFRLREADYGIKGLMYNLMTLNNLLYDGDPRAHLEYEEALASIKTALSGNYFETLIDRTLLNSDHNSITVIKPSKTLAAEKRRNESEKLEKFKKSLGLEGLERLKRENEKLVARQTTPDKKEKLDAIPMLELSDLEREPERLPCIQTKEKGLDLLWHEMNTNKIVYYNMYFDIENVVNALGESHVPYLSLLSRFMGKVDTENYDYGRLANEVDIKFGSLGFQNDIYESLTAADYFNGRFSIRAKVLDGHLEASLRDIDEIINRTVFTNKKRIFELLQEMKIELEAYINQSGNSFASMRLNSHWSKASQYADKLYGIDFYDFVRGILEDFDGQYEGLKKALETVKKHIFTDKNATFSCTADKMQFDAFRELLPAVKLNKTQAVGESSRSEFAATGKSEAFVISSGVSYVVKGGNYRNFGYEYSGKTKVFKRILDLDYLWNTVRVQGGAYGAGAIVRRLGDFNFYSFRDPNVAGTFDVYDRAYEYVKNFDEDVREMTKYIIGTIAELDSPLSNRQKGEESDSNYFSGITIEDLRKERQEILSTTAEDIREYAAMVKDVLEKGKVCVIGNGEKINESKEAFEKIVELS